MPTDDTNSTQKQGDSCLLSDEELDILVAPNVFMQVYRRKLLEQDMERHRAPEGSTPSQKAGGKSEATPDVE